MIGYPGAPRLVKGAILGLDLFNPLASLVLFQYNPETLTRRLDSGGGGQGDGRGHAAGAKPQTAPVETISLEIAIDATDQLERGDKMAVSLGIHPQLAALELLLYPKSALVIANAILAGLGTIEVVPPPPAMTLFVWGPKRVLPVRLTDFSITEEAYDAALNPVRARVSLGLRVLSYNDLPTGDPGRALFLAHQVLKETMATMGSAANMGAFASNVLRSIGGGG